MLPSNMSPTSSPLALIRGLPELPPVMSLLVEMLKRVSRSSWGLACIQLGGMRNGSWPVARSNATLSVVNGFTGSPFSIQACTLPKLSRSVKVASG